jgi:hypothetical protein
MQQPDEFTITSVARTASGGLELLTETGKTGNKPPRNPSETRLLNFNGMHDYAPE